MATVREDVVKVSFDVNDSALKKVDSGINGLVQSTQKLAGSGGVGKMTQGFDQAAKSANALAKTDFASKITAGIEEFNARASIAKDRLSGISKAAQAIAHPIKSAQSAFQALDSKILGVQMGVGRMVAQFKTMAGTKISGLKDSLTNIKNALTQGQSGAKGFATAFKNIGKVSLNAVANGARSLATNLKSAASAGAQKLASGLKSVAKTTMNAVVSGVQKLGTGLKSALTSAGQLAAKLGSFTVKGLTAGIAAATTAIGALGAASIKGYAEYEQLVGGVDTLFGESSKKVQEYANNAYKTAGLSANEYMTTVTSFSASLLQSLGGDTKAAAAAADQAVTDMADNANKMGTSMADIQNAYQGFAKQNYTMLDNLKLGYGGTKEEMERLLKDAEKLTGKKFDVSNFNDITEAIHAIQTEMGITGTTAKEASSTIQGSALAMKSAWSNFLTGMADENADFDTLVNNLIDSVVTFGQNLIPRIQTLVPRLIEGLSQLFQAVVPAIPGILSSLLPALSNGAMQLVNSLISTLQANLPQMASMALTIIGQFAQFLLQALPQIIVIGIELITSLITGIAQQIPQLMPLAIQAIMTIAESLMSNLPTILQAGVQILLALVDGITQMLPQLIQMGMTLIVQLLQGIVNNLPTILQAGIQLILTFITGLLEALPSLIEMVPQIFFAFIEAIFSINWLEVGWNLIKSILVGVWEGACSLVKGIWDGIKGLFGAGGEESGKAAGDGITSGLQSTTPTVTSTANNLATTTNSTLSTVGANAYSYGATANSNLASGLSSTSYMPTYAAANTESMTDNELKKLSTNTASYGTAANTNLASGLNASSYAPVAAAANTEGMTDNELKKLAGKTSQYGSAAASNLASGISSNTGTAVNAASSMSSQVENAASSDVTVKVIGDTSSMNSFVSQVADLVSSSAAKLQDIPTAFDNTLSKANATAKSQLSSINAAFKGDMEKLVSTTTAAMARLLGVVKSGMIAVKAAVTSCNLYSSGENVMNGLVQGMQSKLPMVIAAATAAATAIKRATDKALGINSPAKEMIVRGVYTGEGQALGMLKSIPTIQAAADKMAVASIPCDTYAPDSSGTIYNSGGNTENTTIAPVFNLTVSGTSDDRATARKVKQWVAEAINDAFSSLEYKSRPIREV